MELFLNILWLVIAAGALAVWRIVWRDEEPGSRRSLLREWTSLACVLVFVFFAVSLSDDLRAEAILADDCGRGRHHSIIWDRGHDSRHSAREAGACFSAVTVRPIAAVALEVSEQIVPAVVRVGRSVPVWSLAGRSPPRASLI